MSEQKPLCILYLGNDPDLTQWFKQRLEPARYRVDIAHDGEEGLAMWDPARYDVMAIEQALPVYDGLEVIRRMASRGPLPPILLIADNEPAAAEAMRLGASDYLVRQAGDESWNVLPAMIERLLYQRRLTHEKETALKALQESEARYRGLFDSVPVGLYRITPEGYILDVNLPIVEMLGYPNRESLLSLTIEEYLNLEDRRRFQSVMQREGMVRHFEMQMRCRDGTIIWVETNARAVQDAEGRVLYYEGSVEDITARKQVEEALRRRNRELALLNLVGQELGSTLDLDQVLNTVLSEVRRLMGVIAATVWLVDRETGELVCRQNTGPHASILRGWRLAPGQGIAGWVAQYGESLNISDTRTDPRHFKRVDKTTGVELRSILAVPLKVKHDVIGVLQVVDSTVNRFDTADLTLLESLAASSAIAIENARLYEQAQQEIAERRRAEEALRQRTIELQARNEELDAFAHTVAHDLKGVVARLMGYSMVLEEDYVTMSPEEVQEYLRMIGRDSRRISNIIDELLLLARVPMQEVQSAPLDMGAVVTEALERVGDMAKENSAIVTLPETWPVALGYGPWIQEVWINYISNAIKYGGQPPRVELGATVQEDGYVRFWVRDNGEGIAPEAQSRLFTPFTRLNQINTKGYGLGLSIVQRIVEKLHGQVGVESTLGQGSVFSFTLPAVSPAAFPQTTIPDLINQLP